MSILLDELIRDRKVSSIKYKDYLNKITKLVKRVKDTGATIDYPDSINSKAKRALYDNLDDNEDLAISVHKSILKSKQDDWRGPKIKQKQVWFAIQKALIEFDIEDKSEVDRIFKLAINQDEY